MNVHIFHHTFAFYDKHNIDSSPGHIQVDHSIISVKEDIIVDLCGCTKLLDYFNALAGYLFLEEVEERK